MGASKFSTRWQASVASLASVEKYGQIGKWPWEMIGFNRIQWDSIGKSFAHGLGCAELMNL